MPPKPDRYFNDYAGVDLYYNDGSGRFSDETARLYNRHLFGMGHCFADFDRVVVLDFLAIGMSVPTVRRLEFMKLGRDEFPDRTSKRGHHDDCWRAAGRSRV